MFFPANGSENTKLDTSKETCIYNVIYYNTKVNTTKLKPVLVAFYDMSGNGML